MCPTWVVQSALTTASLKTLNSTTMAKSLQRTSQVVQSESTTAQSGIQTLSTQQQSTSPATPLSVEQWAISQTTTQHTAQQHTILTIPHGQVTNTTTALATPQPSPIHTSVMNQLTTVKWLCKQPALILMPLMPTMMQIQPLLHRVVLVASSAQSTLTI